MNSNDRMLVARIHNILTAVPNAQDGSGGMSASVEGYMKYSRDMRKIMRPIRFAMFEMARPNPDFSKADSLEAIEDYLEEAEAFINKRKAQNWS